MVKKKKDLLLLFSGWNVPQRGFEALTQRLTDDTVDSAADSSVCSGEHGGRCICPSCVTAVRSPRGRLLPGVRGDGLLLLLLLPHGRRFVPLGGAAVVLSARDGGGGGVVLRGGRRRGPPADLCVARPRWLGGRLWRGRAGVLLRPLLRSVRVDPGSLQHWRRGLGLSRDSDFVFGRRRSGGGAEGGEAAQGEVWGRRGLGRLSGGFTLETLPPPRTHSPAAFSWGRRAGPA